MIYPGLPFEKFNVGEEFTPPFFIISQTEMDKFGELTGDKNPLHTDPGFCEQGLFGRPVVHGIGTLAFVMGALHRAGIYAGSCEAFRDMKNVKFLKPIYPGRVLYPKAIVIEKKDFPERPYGYVTLHVSLEDCSGSALLVATLCLLIKKQGK